MKSIKQTANSQQQCHSYLQVYTITYKLYILENNSQHKHTCTNNTTPIHLTKKVTLFANLDKFLLV